MTTITLFTRQRTSTFDPASRELVWAQAGSYSSIEDYGNHGYILEVELQGEDMGFHITTEMEQNKVQEGYTWGRMDNWYSISPSMINSCNYDKFLGASLEGDAVKLEPFKKYLNKLVLVSAGVYTFVLDGEVVIDFNKKSITPADWDEDEWDDNGAFIKKLTKKLFA